jgi:hypothetical protein
VGSECDLKTPSPFSSRFNRRALLSFVKKCLVEQAYIKSSPLHQLEKNKAQDELNTIRI